MNFRGFDVESYIENEAYNKANKAYKRYGQKRTKRSRIMDGDCGTI